VRVCVPHNIENDAQGIALGYAIAREKMLRGLEAQGWVVDDREAGTAVHFCPPWIFSPVRNKRNVLYTMWEHEWIDPCSRGTLEYADAIIVPSQFCADVFRQYARCPIHVVPLGVGTDLFTYKKREIGKPFRFLWVGAPNTRKGWQLVHEVWMQSFVRTKTCELYLKSTQIGCDIMREENMILDGRFLSRSQLVDLYHSAHAFVFPTAGEGFGLTLAEAMATGLPCITTRYSGVLDFTDSQSVRYMDYDRWWTSYNFHTEVVNLKVPVARLQDVADGMEWVIKHYDEALVMAKKGSNRIHKRFTWSQAVSRLADVLGEYVEQSEHRPQVAV